MEVKYVQSKLYSKYVKVLFVGIHQIYNQHNDEGNVLGHVNRDSHVLELTNRDSKVLERVNHEYSVL